MRAELLLLACAVLGACAALAPQDDPRAVVRGPLPTRIQHPLALLSPHLALRRPVAQPAGELGVGTTLSYSSIFEDFSVGDYSARFDGELGRWATRLRYGLGGGWDLEGELALLHASGGFLDEFVSGFHDSLGFPNQGRETVGNDEYAMRVGYQGREAYALEPYGLQLQDVPLFLTWGDDAPRRGAWSRAVRVGVELPAGSESAGAGNGALDWTVGALVERSFGAFTHTAQLSFADTHTPASFDGTPIELSDLFELQYACELRWTDATSLVVQLDGQSPLTDDVPYEELDSPILDFGVGLVRDTGERSRAFLSFHDDLLSAAGPDFTVTCGWSWNL